MSLNTFYPGSLLLVEVMEVMEVVAKRLIQRALCRSKKNLREAKVVGVDEEGEAEEMEVVVARNQIHLRSSGDRLFTCNEVVLIEGASLF
jgi:hypothetical protein